MAGTLHLVCGKIASGKSGLCARLAAAPDTVLIDQDRWLKCLFGDELSEVADYLRVLPRLCAAIGPHVTDLLEAGLDVVLDFPANTVAMRAWMKGLADAAHARHVLHLLDVPDEDCRARLHARNAAGTHDFTASDAQFDALGAYFQPPTAAEELNVVAANSRAAVSAPPGTPPSAAA